MNARHRTAQRPREVIALTNYHQLELYLGKFAARSLGLVVLLGRHGTGKSESVRRILTASMTGDHGGIEATEEALFIEGHMQPFGLYRHLWEYRNRPVVLDDLDRLYADPDCVRLLKPLCNTIRHKRLHWLTNATLNETGISGPMARCSVAFTCGRTLRE